MRATLKSLAPRGYENHGHISALPVRRISVEENDTPNQTCGSDVAFARNLPPLSQWIQSKRKSNDIAIHTFTQAVSTCYQASEAAVSEGQCPLIAVVDDEPVIAVTLSELLSRHGFRAVWFTSPLRALEFTAQVRIDLLISDLQMPELDGWDLALRVATLRPDCLVLFLSGNSELLGKITNMQGTDGRLHFAQKPIAVDDLVALVHQLLVGSRPECLQRLPERASR